ncbi:MAG: DUF3298 domain-containing protein [Lachnospiraceae bacterium]|nr:DUF3298 domain-containing protein [Lachnospiraceae bacterium]MEE0918940.1 RsiV family protein [Lachnospiraceae bacterium]
MSNKRLEEYKDEYQSIKMSNESYKQMLLYMEKAKKERTQNMKKQRKYAGWILAAAAITLVILPNTSSTISYAMTNIPILGNFFKLVTVREFKYEDDSKFADIDISQIDIENITNEEIASNVEKTADDINKEIQRLTEQLENEFKENLKTEGYYEVTVKSDIIATTDNYFTVRVTAFEAAASGYEKQHYYTIDLNTGNRLNFSDLFKDGVDYQSEIANIIESEMREQMKNDDSKIYFVDDEFVDIKDSINNAEFYFNENGNLVISFNECEVAPAYMGVVQFVIENEEIESILK